jgi:hypothetical protein
MTGKGWLILGFLVAIGTVSTNAADALAASLGRFVPLPWARIGVAILVFWAFAGIHFRAHWAATQDGARLRDSLREDLDDAGRSVAIVEDNLREVLPDPADDRADSLYLAGAHAHARRLLAVVERARLRLERQEPPTGGPGTREPRAQG